MSISGEWQRLAELLISRRVALGYPRRADFVRARKLKHARTVDDLENARRTNYEPSTLAHMELVYEWEPGSVRRVLAGENPVEKTGTEVPTAATDDDVPTDPLFAQIGRALSDETLPEDLRQNLRRGVQRAYDVWLEWVKTLGQEPSAHNTEGVGR